jgi:hypothetical protein
MTDGSFYRSDACNIMGKKIVVIIIFQSLSVRYDRLFPHITYKIRNEWMSLSVGCLPDECIDKARQDAVHEWL